MRCSMREGIRVLFLLACLFTLVATVFGESPSDDSLQPGPPAAPRQPVTDDVQGHKIVDNYRWLEDANSRDTQQWVSDELTYTRKLLDPLPRREQLRQRLTQLMEIGTVSAPQPAGKYYFYTRRGGQQNQPVLLVREDLHGKDRVLVDVNQLAADGTVALDWWEASEDGKYVAYGTSRSGSEMSTLRLIE